MTITLHSFELASAVTYELVSSAGRTLRTAKPEGCAPHAHTHTHISLVNHHHPFTPIYLPWFPLSQSLRTPDVMALLSSGWRAHTHSLTHLSLPLTSPVVFDVSALRDAPALLNTVGMKVRERQSPGRRCHLCFWYPSRKCFVCAVLLPWFLLVYLLKFRKSMNGETDWTVCMHVSCLCMHHSVYLYWIMHACAQDVFMSSYFGLIDFSTWRKRIHCGREENNRKSVGKDEPLQKFIKLCCI